MNYTKNIKLMDLPQKHPKKHKSRPFQGDCNRGTTCLDSL